MKGPTGVVSGSADGTTDRAVLAGARFAACPRDRCEVAACVLVATTR